MAISVEHDRLIPLRNTPSYVQKFTGRRVHLSTVFRWRLRGIAGVTLETISIGGQTYTTVEAILAFFKESTAAKRRRQPRASEAEKSRNCAKANRLAAEAESLGI